MNNVNLIGRITKDLELKYSQAAEPMAILKFTLAVNRMKKDEADFINCLAFGKTAENISKFFGKGKLIGLNGHIQTGSYDNKEGNKVYTTEVVVDKFDFLEKRDSSDASNQPASPKTDANGFVKANEVDDSDLPF